jgi:hypothetical protein
VRLAERGIADTREATWEHSGAQLERILIETCFARLPGPGVVAVSAERASSG